MLELKNSDVFNNYLNTNNSILGKVNMILTGAEPSTVFLNEVLFADIKRKIIDRRRDPVVTKMGNAIVEGRIVLFAVAPEKNISSAIPFFVYKQDGRKKVAVNLTSVVIRSKDESGNVVYDLGDNVNKVYSMIYSAYLALDVFDPKAILTQDALTYSAIIWADMFTKPVYDVYGMNNLDRVKAFKYFAMKFFLGYYMECTENQINDIVMKYFKEKNQLIVTMEDIIAAKGLNLYDGFTQFCNIMFNNEITMIKGVRVNNVENVMNVSFYLQKFDQTFHRNALLSLCSFPYFIYTIIAATSKCNLVKDKSFDRIFKDNGAVVNRLLVAILK